MYAYQWYVYLICGSALWYQPSPGYNSLAPALCAQCGSYTLYHTDDLSTWYYWAVVTCACADTAISTATLPCLVSMRWL